jgi:HEXXH motif-containing protein
MTLRRHRLPRDVFAALAAGGGGSTAIGYLTAAQRSKHLLLLRGVVDWAATTGHTRAPQVRHAYDLLADLQTRVPDAVEAVLRHPPVGAWAHRTLRALDEDGMGKSDEPARLAAVAAAAAIRAGLRCEVEVPVIDDMVMLPSLGAVIAPRQEADAIVRSGPAGAEVVLRDGSPPVPIDAVSGGPRWLPVRTLSAKAEGTTIKLSIDDLDPFRMPAATDLTGRLSARDLLAWDSAVQSAWGLLTRWHWTTAAEVAGLISVLTPRISPAHGQVGATSHETFGSVALSAPTDGRTFAVTLAHESQHAKLFAILDIVTLTAPDDGRFYYAPWRDDPRPISGLLHGAYAYLGVTGFWRRQRHHEHGQGALKAHTEFARWREATWRVVQRLLLSGRLTAAGETFVAGMARTLLAWQYEHVPVSALAAARTAADRHRHLWDLHHGDRDPCDGQLRQPAC